MKSILFWVALAGFLIYRPYAMQSTGLLYGGDDQNYFAHATALVYGCFPDYTRETNADFPPFHPFGSSLLAAPFVAAGSFLDRITGSPVAHQRYGSSLASSWTLFGFVLASQFYLCLGILFLFMTLRLYVSRRIAEVVILLGVVSSGLLLYVDRRPVFSHVYEFMAVAGTLYAYALLLRAASPQTACRAFAGVVAGSLWIYLVRYNDAILAAGFILAGGLALMSHFGKSRGVVSALLGLALLAGTALGARYMTRHILRDDKYAVSITSSPKTPGRDLYQETGPTLIQRYSVSFYFRRLLHVLVGIDWGLLYTAPLFLLSVLGFNRTTKRLPYVWIPAAALLVNLYICIIWGAQGSFYGYRYMLYAWLPFSSLMLAVFLEHHPVSKFWLLLLSLLPTASVLMFEGNATSLTLSVGRTAWSSGWVNNTYQWAVWHTLFHPKEAFAVAFKGGPVYVGYLLAVLLRQTAHLPAQIRQRYPFFDEVVFLKTLLLWFFPALFYGLSKKLLSFDEH